jgi:DNA polymerase-3 subunit delta'
LKNIESLKQELYSMINGGRVPHASIFVGKMGYGVLDVAMSFAQALLCTALDKNKIPCNECAACGKASKIIHPDFHFAFPVIKKGDKKRSDTTSKDFLGEWRELSAETLYFSMEDWARKIDAANKQLNINTTECNEIIKKLGLTAFEGGNKVLIIYMAEFLAKEGNRLLKLIEEPPENTYIILLAERQEALLNTILSRCQIFSVGPMSDEDIRTRLAGQIDDPDRLDFIVFLAQGDLHKAMNLAQGDTTDLSTDVISWLRNAYLFNKNPKAIIDWIEDFSKMSKTAQNAYLEYMLHFLREYQLSLFVPDTRLRLSEEEKNAAMRLKKIIDIEKVEKLSQICDTLYYNLSRNVNSKIELMNASIEINNLLHKKVVLSS